MSQVFPHFRRLLVHGVPACDKGHNAARTHLIQCFGKEIVVDGESQPVIGLVTDLIVAEWDIAHGKVIEIPAVCGFKTGNRNLCLRIQFLRDTACDGIQLHTVQAAVLHRFRQHPEEVSDTHGGLQDIPGLESHLPQCVIDRSDYGGAGVVGIQRGCPCHFIILLREKGFQLRILPGPAIFVGIESIRKAAPTDILGKSSLLLRCGIPVFRFKGKQRFDGSDVTGKFLLRPTFPEMVIRDTEVDAGDIFFGNFFLNRNRNSFCGCFFLFFCFCGQFLRHLYGVCTFCDRFRRFSCLFHIRFLCLFQCRFNRLDGLFLFILFI